VQILRVLGRAEVARDVIEALMLDRGLRREFDPAVREEARRVARSEPRDGRDGHRRRDLRALPTFTIDPQSARDFDDAISAERTKEGLLRVWVHIADVTAYVRERSVLDREARRRSTSVYVPGAVEPMLPTELSADACSLMPGRDRLAVTVELELDGARVLRSSFYRSLISSDQRLDYERVDRIFAGRERAADRWGGALELAREAALALGAARSSRSGALELDAPEPQIELGDSGDVASISLRAQTESHRLIEHLMIAANEAVAELLQKRGVPCLYRVHERPQPQRVKLLVEQLASLGVQTPPTPEQMSPSQAAELIGQISQGMQAHLRQAAQRARRRDERSLPPDGGRLALTSLLLRSLQQAYYSPRNAGHAGLGSDCYCHFTSPIRRYPDIVCHRALLSALGEDEPQPRAGELAELGEWTSTREREAMSIERAADDVARCFMLEAMLYEQGFEQSFVGEVGGLISAGAFISFDLPRAAIDSPGSAPALSGAGDGAGAAGFTPRFEGMLPVRRMRGADGDRDWWQLNELGTILHGERSGESLRLGQAVAVRVARVEALRGRVDLQLAE
jgi:ribonuclease R